MPLKRPKASPKQCEAIAASGQVARPSHTATDSALFTPMQNDSQRLSDWRRTQGVPGISLIGSSQRSGDEMLASQWDCATLRDVPDDNKMYGHIEIKRGLNPKERRRTLPANGAVRDTLLSCWPSRDVSTCSPP